MRRHLSCVSLLFALSACPLRAATPFEGELPIELARYFTNGGQWYAELPAGMPAFQLPAGLEVVGSLDQGQRKQVLFRVTGAGADMREALAQAFLANPGWERMEFTGITPRSTGFVTGNDTAAPSRNVTLCSDSAGTLSIASRESGFINLSLSELTRGMPPCSQQQRMRGMRGDAGGLSAVMPVLEIALPEREGNLPLLSLPQSFSSGGDSAEASTQVRLPDTSLRALANDFTRQMRRQGWYRQEAWRGDVTAGSTWVRELEDERRIMAVIDLVLLGEDDYSLRLRLGELSREE